MICRCNQEQLTQARIEADDGSNSSPNVSGLTPNPDELHELLPKPGRVRSVAPRHVNLQIP